MCDEATLNLWKQRLAPYDTSGLTVAEFCRRIGITERQFRYWRRRLDYGSRPAFPCRPVSAQHTTFAAVAIVPEETIDPPGGQLIIEVGPARIPVARGFDALLLGEVVQALAGSYRC